MFLHPLQTCIFKVFNRLICAFSVPHSEITSVELKRKIQCGNKSDLVFVLLTERRVHSFRESWVRLWTYRDFRPNTFLKTFCGGFPSLSEKVFSQFHNAFVFWFEADFAHLSHYDGVPTECDVRFSYVPITNDSHRPKVQHRLRFFSIWKCHSFLPERDQKPIQLRGNNFNLEGNLSDLCSKLTLRNL